MIHVRTVCLCARLLVPCGVQVLTHVFSQLRTFTLSSSSRKRLLAFDDNVSFGTLLWATTLAIPPGAQSFCAVP